MITKKLLSKVKSFSGLIKDKIIKLLYFKKLVVIVIIACLILSSCSLDINQSVFWGSMVAGGVITGVILAPFVMVSQMIFKDNPPIPYSPPAPSALIFPNYNRDYDKYGQTPNFFLGEEILVSPGFKIDRDVLIDLEKSNSGQVIIEHIIPANSEDIWQLPNLELGYYNLRVYFSSNPTIVPFRVL